MPDSRRIIRVLPRLEAERHAAQPGEVCVSITNPRQSPARLGGFSQVLRLGFHDTDRPGGNFTLMSRGDARALLAFCAEYRNVPITVHCEFGASRSVAAGLFLAVWLRRPLLLNSDVLAPNPWVLRQLRRMALAHALRWWDGRLLWVALRGAAKFRYEVLPAAVADTYLH